MSRAVLSSFRVLRAGCTAIQPNSLPCTFSKYRRILPLAGQYITLCGARHKSNTAREDNKTFVIIHVDDIAIMIKARPPPKGPRPAKPKGESRRPPRPDDLIKARSCLKKFFSQFSGFKYDPAQPYMNEFHRLVRLKKWDPKGEEYKNARKGINDAGVQQFNRSIGTEVDDLAAWHRVFGRIEGEGLPKTIEECQIVNICDVLDARATGKKARNFGNLDKLRKYTSDTEKYFPREHVSAGAILEFLLRHIHTRSGLFDE
ncbi:hypothetical protein FRC10_007867 [Ceratobasidium sp. 414]|nr:hypothetical protein FRC10_007867 [Ceratobasidium sp. 414]